MQFHVFVVNKNYPLTMSWMS